MADFQLCVQQDVAAVLSNASSGSVIAIVNALAQRMREDAEAAAEAAKQAAKRASVKSVKGETFQAVADINGFTLEIGDGPGILCSFGAWPATGGRRGLVRA